MTTYTDRFAESTVTKSQSIGVNTIIYFCLKIHKRVSQNKVALSVCPHKYPNITNSSIAIHQRRMLQSFSTTSTISDDHVVVNICRQTLGNKRGEEHTLWAVEQTKRFSVSLPMKFHWSNKTTDSDYKEVS